MGDMLYDVSTWLLPLIVAVTFHEAAHGFVAWLRGDDTAKRMGRVTFNPIKHIDRFGTIILPGLMLLAKSPVMFGYAKPVPVNFGALKNPKTDMILVALAGPGINIVLAMLAALALSPLLASSDLSLTKEWIAMNLVFMVIINCALAVFNMLPFLPLDGGRVLVGLLPNALGRRFARSERYGILVIFAALLIPAVLLDMGLIDSNPVAKMIGIPIQWLSGSLLGWAGINSTGML